MSHIRDRKKSFRNFFFNLVPNGVAFSRPSRIDCALVRREIRTGTWSIYSHIGAKIEISSEKRVPVRISRRTKAQSIREGLENATLLGTKLKKITKTFFTIPYVSRHSKFVRVLIRAFEINKCRCQQI